MAYDKVVDSSVLDAGLKAIADAIREKGGTSDNLEFPTAMAEAIAAIESGGGSGGDEIDFTTGIIYGDGNKVETNLTVEHGLGNKPEVVAFYALNATVNTVIFAAYCSKYTFCRYVGAKTSSGSNRPQNITVNENSFVIPVHESYDFKLYASGHRWIAIRFK